MNRRQVIVGACALPLVAGVGPRGTYRRAHRAVTRELVIYREFSTALLLRATLLTPDFRLALAAERRRLVDPTDTDHADFVARMEADGAAFHEVVLVADSALLDGEPFGPADHTRTPRLEIDGALATLVTAEHVRDPTPVHRTLYPQLTKWSSLWIARWGRQPGRSIVLHVGSGYGHGEVEWELN